MMRTELFTAGTRLAFDWLGMQTARLGVGSLYLSAPDCAIAQAWLWRLPQTIKEVFVDETATGLLLPDQWRITVQPLPPSHSPFLSIYPFTLDATNAPFQGAHVLGCLHNRLSYRGLLHSRESGRNLRWLRQKAQREGYNLETTIGIYPPAFVWRWALTMLAARISPRLEDYWRQRAFEHLASRQPFALQFSSILAFHARRVV